MIESLTRNLGLELVRATEAAALVAGRWMGRGDLITADQEASKSMHEALSTIDLDGTIIIGEEAKLGAHSPLDSGHHIGTGKGPQMDIVLDPIDGRKLLAQSRPDAISVAAIASKGSMWRPYPAIYMEKIVVDRDTAPYLVPECMDAPAGWTLALVARAKKKAIRDLVVFVLDRPRHQDLIEEIRTAGARVLLRLDGDIAGALMAASPNIKVDVLMGTGGTSEGLIAACAVKSLQGGMLARLSPQSEVEKAAIKASDLNPKQILFCNDLVRGNDIVFAATGITSGNLFSGVSYDRNMATTESLVLRCETHTRRFIHTEYTLE